MGLSDIGLIGLAVMGENLVLNMESHGFGVAVFNRTFARTDEFMQGRARGKNIQAGASLEELVRRLKKPRRIMMMVKAGPAVDEVLASLRPLLEPGDILIDGGNSYYRDTERRADELAGAGLNYLGVGVSGGEEGALDGPSIMPGGQPEAYEQVAPIYRAIAAQVDGEPCVTYIGPRGSGHYVKMVHNGIEYGDMQLISEAYDLMSRGLGMPAGEIAGVFERWNRGALSSYLVEITATVLRKVDAETGKPLVDEILDTAEQKGTGKWTSEEGFELGYPIPTINTAVEGRILSALKSDRVKAARAFPRAQARPGASPDRLIDRLESALYASKICSYAQGFGMMGVASREHQYGLDLAKLALIWRGGCIIRAGFLGLIAQAYQAQPDLPNLLLAPHFHDALLEGESGWRETISTAVQLGVPLAGISSSLAYFDSLRSERLPANLIQAQRDLFGAHTYRRVDREGVFHTQWE